MKYGHFYEVFKVNGMFCMWEENRFQYAVDFTIKFK